MASLLGAKLSEIGFLTSLPFPFRFFFIDATYYIIHGIVWLIHKTIHSSFLCTTKHLLQTNRTLKSYDLAETNQYSLVEFMLGNWLFADLRILILSFTSEWMILELLDSNESTFFFSPKIFSCRWIKISSLERTLIKSSSLSSFLKSSKEHYFVCFLAVMFFFMSLTTSMKNFSIVIFPSMNLELKVTSSRFCLFRCFICFWSRLYYELIYGLREN